MKNENKPLIKYTTPFDRQRKAVPVEIKIAFRETLELFLDDPKSPHLRNHELREKFSGYRSIDITDDWRALFKIKKDKTQTVITFHILGTHEELYG